jgi:hypothetical protein
VHSRLLVPSVLRPFGEHLVALLHVESGDACVDIGSEVMPALLGRTARLCIAIDDSVVVEDTAAVVRAHGDALPLGAGCAQVVTSLFTLPDQRDPVATLREMLRVLDPHRGRLAGALWSEPDATPHLGALIGAYDDVGGDVPAELRSAVAYGHPLAAEHLVEQAGGAARLGVSRIHDVVRFDGASHYWAAMTGDSPPPEEVRRAAEARLEAYVAADGTMRIPTEAVLLTTATPPSPPPAG